METGTKTLILQAASIQLLAGFISKENYFNYVYLCMNFVCFSYFVFKKILWFCNAFNRNFDELSTICRNLRFGLEPEEGFNMILDDAREQ